MALAPVPTYAGPMSQNPYADPGADVFPEAERTSVMAILSLICSLICCIPGLGLLGVVLGVFSLIGIGGSRGRVGGKGLAISGIVLGLLVSVIWIGLVIGGNGAFKAYQGLVGPIMTNIEARDYDAARGSFDATLSTIDDASLDAFRAAYQAELGSYQRAPKGWIEYFQLFVDPNIGPHMQKYQGRNDIIPNPAVFDQGAALMIFHIDPANQSGNQPVFNDVAVVLSDGTEIILTDYAGDLTPPPADSAPDAAPEPDPEADPETDPAP